MLVMGSCKETSTEWLTGTRENFRGTLPLPDSIRDLFKPQFELDEENDSDHQGRARSFPHVRGNWATYILIPFTPDPLLVKLVENLQKCLQPDIDVHVMDDFHVSLSRTFTIPFHCIEPLKQSLKKELLSFNKFMIDFNKIEFYTNDEKSRSFVGLKVDVGEDILTTIVHTVDAVLKEFKLPKFYEDPSFHMSVCWALDDVNDQLTDKWDSLQRMLTKFQKDDPDSLTSIVTEICCKTGNKTFTFDLGS